MQGWSKVRATCCSFLKHSLCIGFFFFFTFVFNECSSVKNMLKYKKVSGICSVGSGYQSDLFSSVFSSPFKAPQLWLQHSCNTIKWETCRLKSSLRQSTGNLTIPWEYRSPLLPAIMVLYLYTPTLFLTIYLLVLFFISSGILQNSQGEKVCSLKTNLKWCSQRCCSHSALSPAQSHSSRHTSAAMTPVEGAKKHTEEESNMHRHTATGHWRIHM